MKRAILQKSGGASIADVEVCVGFIDRAVGLLGRRSLGSGRAMLIAPCQSIHTWFMRFNIDLIFLAEDWRVLGICRDVRPWRFRCGPPGAWGVLEVASGWLSPGMLGEGDSVELLPGGGSG